MKVCKSHFGVVLFIGLLFSACNPTNVMAQNVPDGLEFTIQGNSVIITGYAGIPQTLVIPNRIQGSPVTRIEGAFNRVYNRLTSVTIPNTVVFIGDNAFRNNRLTTVTIPNSVVAIGANAFQGNQLTNVTIPVINIGRHAFANNQLTSVTIGVNVEFIADYAFSNNLLTSVTIGANVRIECCCAFGNGFTDAYNGTAGTYTRPDVNSRTWTRR